MKPLCLLSTLVFLASGTLPMEAGEDALEDFVAITRLNERKQTPELAAACRQFLTEHPGTKADDSVRFFLGQALATQKQFDEAITVFTDLIDKHATSPLIVDARMQRGEAYRNSERLQESVPDFKIAWEGYRAAGSADSAEPPPTPGLRREGSRGVEKGNRTPSDPGPSAGREPRG